MIKITPENLKLVPEIGQYKFYLEGRCVNTRCKGVPKLFYQKDMPHITAWSLCIKCSKNKGNANNLVEYSEKELFTIKLYET